MKTLSYGGLLVVVGGLLFAELSPAASGVLAPLPRSLAITAGITKSHWKMSLQFEPSGSASLQYSNQEEKLKPSTLLLRADEANALWEICRTSEEEVSYRSHSTQYKVEVCSANQNRSFVTNSVSLRQETYLLIRRLERIGGSDRL